MKINFRKKTAVKTVSRYKKKLRIRKKVLGTTERPRLTVFKSDRHMYVQLIDDVVGRTLVSCSTLQDEIKGKNKETAKQLGAMVAKRAKEKNITLAVFDRNGYQYHGKIKILADSAREAGLQF